MKYCENWGQVGFLIDLIFLLKKKDFGSCKCKKRCLLLDASSSHLSVQLCQLV